MTQQERDKRITELYKESVFGGTFTVNERHWNNFIESEAYKSIPPVSNPEITEADQPDKPTEWDFNTATDREQMCYQKGYEQGVSDCSLYCHEKIQDSVSSTSIHGCFDDAIHGTKLTQLIESFPIELPTTPQKQKQ